MSSVQSYLAIDLADVVLRHRKVNPFGYTGLIGLGRIDDGMIW